LTLTSHDNSILLRQQALEKSMKEEDTYLRQNQIIELLGISPSTFWRIRKSNDSSFPVSLSISSNIKIWRRSDVINWIKNKGK